MHRVGFLVNPIAGMGGRVGLKGTDGVVDEALNRGATPVAPSKAQEMLTALRARPQANEIEWVTSSGSMGEDCLRAAGVAGVVAHRSASPTTAKDTENACREFLARGVEIVVFVGGDGTARDIASVIGTKLPILGVPSGVKMHSAVFGLHPASVAAILADFVDGNTATVEAEVLDLDEDRYRQGEWVVRLFATAHTLHEPTLIQTGKMMFEELPDQDARDGIAEHLIEEMDESPVTLYLLGPGGTLRHVKERLGIGGTLLGVDAVLGKHIVASDLDEGGILRLLDAHSAAKLVLSPIGAQGFLLGRGNLEVSPEVVRRIGLKNVIVVATPDKLRHTPALRVDTGDPALDREFAEKEYLFVVQGYRETRVQPIQP
ncbi:MAG TPA: ATP-NAD kinase family protein [Thermoplasmata archaeon]|nr:ATP-NAD kinase family protein [Thermoplasmata archaeon]